MPIRTYLFERACITVLMCLCIRMLVRTAYVFVRACLLLSPPTPLPGQALHALRTLGFWGLFIIYLIMPFVRILLYLLSYFS